MCRKWGICHMTTLQEKIDRIFVASEIGKKVFHHDQVDKAIQELREEINKEIISAKEIGEQDEGISSMITAYEYVLALIGDKK